MTILLPCGVGSGSFSVRLVDDAQCLVLSVKWPEPFLDLPVMHKKLISNSTGFEMCHPKVSGFEASLKRLRKKTTYFIELCARIILFAVQSHILSKHNLGWRENGSRIVYVDLRAVVEE